MQWTLERIPNTFQYYKLNGVVLKISPEMIQELYHSPYAKEVEKHIMNMYHKEIGQIRNKKITELFIR